MKSVRIALNDEELKLPIDKLAELCGRKCIVEITEEIDRERKFNEICDRYRAMMKANEGKSHEEQRDAINKFRSGLMG